MYFLFFFWSYIILLSRQYLSYIIANRCMRLLAIIRYNWAKNKILNMTKLVLYESILFYFVQRSLQNENDIIKGNFQF